MNPLKIIYVGTGEIGTPILTALVQDSRFEISCVITGEDKKIGRNQKLQWNPIKSIGLEIGLPIYQPQKISELNNKIIQYEPDFLLVMAFGQILPKSTLDIAKHGTINIHPSLLPKFRGATPFQSAILAGEKNTGVSWILMNEKMDEGNILDQVHSEIREDDTSLSLSERLQKIAVDHTGDVLVTFANKHVSHPQDHSRATYCRKFTKIDGKLDFLHDSADEIERKIRAFTPWPGTFTKLDEKNIKILKARVVEQKISPNQIVISPQKTMLVGTPQAAIEILEIQPEGKKQMPIQAYIHGLKNGAPIMIG